MILFQQSLKTRVLLDRNADKQGSWNKSYVVQIGLMER